jgi:hypothetical protein
MVLDGFQIPTSEPKTPAIIEPHKVQPKLKESTRRGRDVANKRFGNIDDPACAMPK